MSMFVAHSKRKAIEEIEEEDVQIVGPPMRKKKGTSAPKKPRKKNVKKKRKKMKSPAQRIGRIMT